MHYLTCAIIRKDDKVLICQRLPSVKHALKWEFPGRITESHLPTKANLSLKIREELSIDILVGRPLEMTQQGHKSPAHCLYPVLCTFSSGEVTSQKYVQVMWVPPAELLHFDWTDTDRPIVDEYTRYLENSNPPSRIREAFLEILIGLIGFTLVHMFFNLYVGLLITLILITITGIYTYYTRKNISKRIS
ncbi:CTP pyrophosphohydrolase [compost metagenome]